MAIHNHAHDNNNNYKRLPTSNKRQYNNVIANDQIKEIAIP